MSALLTPLFAPANFDVGKVIGSIEPGKGCVVLVFNLRLLMIIRTRKEVASNRKLILRRVQGQHLKTSGNLPSEIPPALIKDDS